MNVLVLYDSIGGNTEKIAKKIASITEKNSLQTTIIKVTPNLRIDLNSYDIIFCGSPTIEWLPTATMMSFLKDKLKEHRIKDISPCAPLRPGKFAICFCSFCGAHIGLEEATPTTHWLAAFFGHLGYLVVDKIHLPGEMRRPTTGDIILKVDDATLKENNVFGIFGNVIGRPNDHDLANLEKHITGLLKHISAIHLRD